MPEKPFFSIIIPTYNRGSLICGAVNSVLAQSFPDFELVIVDDGSVDNTKQVISEYTDLRVKYYYKDNSGVSAARNYGVDFATGEYLIFLDSDDFFYHDILNVIHQNIIKNNRPEIIFSDAEVVYENKRSKILSARYPFGVKSNIGLYLSGAYCLSKSFFIQVGGFDTNLNYGENAEIRIRIEKIKHRYAITDHISIKYCNTPGGGSKNFENRLKDVEYTIAKHPEYFKNNLTELKTNLQANAVILARLNRFKDAQILIRRAFITYPADLMLFCRLLIIHIPFIARSIWRLHK